MADNTQFSTGKTQALTTGSNAAWVTLQGDGAMDVVQPPETWFDTAQASSFKVITQVLGTTNCTLSMETAMRQEGPWVSFDDTTQTYNRTNQFSSFDPDQQQGRWVRWKVSGTGDWKLCFRLSISPLHPRGVSNAGAVGTRANTLQTTSTNVATADMLRRLLSGTQR